MDVATLYYLSAAALVLACIAAWLLNVVPSLPGNWLIVACAAVFAWLFPEEADRGVRWMTVLILLGLAVVGEILEFVAGAAGAARRGASRRAVVLSVVGALAGSVTGLAIGAPIPVVGSFVMAVLGGAAGAFLGAYLGEHWKGGRTEEERVAIGRGAFFGRIWGTVGKLAVGAIMVAIVTRDAFF